MGKASRTLTFTKPMSLAYSRKHCLQMLRLYLRMIPHWFAHTRLLSEGEGGGVSEGQGRNRSGLGHKTLENPSGGCPGNGAETAAGGSNRRVRIDQRSQWDDIDAPWVVHALASIRDRRRAEPPTAKIWRERHRFPVPRVAGAGDALTSGAGPCRCTQPW